MSPNNNIYKFYKIGTYIFLENRSYMSKDEFYVTLIANLLIFSTWRYWYFVPFLPKTGRPTRLLMFNVLLSLEKKSYIALSQVVANLNLLKFTYRPWTSLEAQISLIQWYSGTWIIWRWLWEDCVDWREVSWILSVWFDFIIIKFIP